MPVYLEGRENIYDNKTAWGERENKKWSTLSLGYYNGRYIMLSYELHAFDIHLSNRINKFIYKSIVIFINYILCEIIKQVN